MQKKILQQIPSIILTWIICLIIIITGFHLLNHKVIAQDDGDWQVTIELYPETPAKNQEVLLLVFVENNNGMPVPNLPLNITLNDLMSLPEEKDFQFLTDPNPITNEKGEYKIIFNAPTLEWHRDGVYEIIVKIKLNDGSILSNSKEFKVQEKIFDTKNDNEPESAAPGAWYKIIFYDVDFEPITVSNSQNGVTQTKTWKIDDWESGGGMYEVKGKVEKKTVYEIHYIKDEFNALFRLDGDSQSLINMEGYPDKTLIYKFLVTEIQNNNISVSFSMFINGQHTTRLIEIPTVPLYRPTYGLTDRLGQWFFLTHFDSDPPWGTRQNDDLLIYGIGFNGNVKLEIYNTTNIVHIENKSSQNYVTLFKWNVPKNISDGKYSLVLEGNDINNEFFKHEIKFYIEKEPKKMGGIHEEPIISSESFKIYLFIVLSIIIIIVLGTLVYTRLKRKKLLNHIIRKKIYEHIKLNPGIHFRALLNNLKLNTGTLTHHLKILEREQFIREYQDGMYRRFSLFSETPTKIINLPIIQEKLLTIIKENPGITQSNISRKIGNSRSNINYHIKILNDSGIISIEKQGRISQCYLIK